jgi:hypothetical protein
MDCMCPAPLKAIGFWPKNEEWSTDSSSDLPDPRRLTCRSWRPHERPAILNYLRAGSVEGAYAGFSYCRFRLCLTPRPRMGSRDLTDGEWVWPEGLAHYVERHAVWLPDEFLETMKSRSWDPRRGDPSERGSTERRAYDFSFWVGWAKNHQRPRWFVF